MKVIIAGSRDIDDYSLVERAVGESGFEVTEVVSGGARGVDFLGEQWALNNNIQTTAFPAQWAAYGRAAGPMRNEKMAQYADALIAVWDGKSSGTRNMIENAEKRGLKVFVYKVEGDA